MRSHKRSDLYCMWSTRLGCRSFWVCGPTIWKTLPQNLQSTDTWEQFKHRLKTGYSSVHMAGGASDRRCVSGLTYLLTNWWV